jgi:hypothetical protein
LEWLASIGLQGFRGDMLKLGVEEEVDLVEIVGEKDCEAMGMSPTQVKLFVVEVAKLNPCATEEAGSQTGAQKKRLSQIGLGYDSQQVVGMAESIESAIIDAPLEIVWSSIRLVDFSWCVAVKGAAKLQSGASLASIGSTRIVTWADNDSTWQLLDLLEVDDVNRRVSWEVIASEPSLACMAQIHTIFLARVTDTNATYIQWNTEFSNDATNQVVADSKWKKRDAFNDLRNNFEGGRGGPPAVPAAPVAPAVPAKKINNDKQKLEAADSSLETRQTEGKARRRSPPLPRQQAELWAGSVAGHAAVESEVTSLETRQTAAVESGVSSGEGQQQGQTLAAESESTIKSGEEQQQNRKSRTTSEFRGSLTKRMKKFRPSISAAEIHVDQALGAALYCTVLHSIALHCTPLHCTALHCTPLYCTPLHAY